MRSLHPELKAYLDARVPSLVLSPTGALIAAALACEGIVEAGGDNRGVEVEWFQSTVGAAVREPWCIAILQGLIAYVEDRYCVTSPLPATEHAMTLWANSVPYRAPAPKPGCIVLWRLGATSSGHGGLIHKVDSLTLWTVEGNTGPAAGIERNGDGVYLKRRAKGGSKTFREVGFLNVFAE